MQIEFLLIFNTALLACVSHCVGMCGGFCGVINAKASKANQNIWIANLLYNLGRLCSYVCIGVLCGGIGLQFQLSATSKAFFSIGVGGLIVLFALLMLFAPKYLAFLEPNLTQGKGIKKLFAWLLDSQSYRSFVAFGILNGFLPCGIVYYFALVALASGGIWQGMLVMFIFGICTFIPMFALGIFSGLLFNLNQYRIVIFRIGMGLMCLFGLLMIYKGFKAMP